MTYVPHELYSIYFYDHTGKTQFLAQQWTRLAYNQRINSSWNHQLTLEFGADDPRLATYRAIEDDWIMVVYRIDPITLIEDVVYEGFNTTVVDQVRENGNIIINLYGVGYTDLLKRRVILPSTGASHNIKTGPAETVIKEYVGDSMVSPVDANRIFPGMGIESTSGTGGTVTYEARYVNLYSVCQTLSENGNIDFGIDRDTTIGTFIFKAKPIWGTDRRSSVIFSIANDNMVIPILSLNSSAEQNFAYVGGSGEGVDRIIETIANITAIARSPWGRKEVFVEARQQSETQALLSTGQNELVARKKEQKLTFNVRQSVQSRWLREWFLGDLITAEYSGYTFEKQIIEIGVAVTAGETAQQPEVISVELADYEKTLYA